MPSFSKKPEQANKPPTLPEDVKTVIDLVTNNPRIQLTREEWGATNQLMPVLFEAAMAHNVDTGLIYKDTKCHSLLIGVLIITDEEKRILEKRLIAESLMYQLGEHCIMARAAILDKLETVKIQSFQSVEDAFAGLDTKEIKQALSSWDDLPSS